MLGIMHAHIGARWFRRALRPRVCACVSCVTCVCHVRAARATTDERRGVMHNPKVHPADSRMIAKTIFPAALVYTYAYLRGARRDLGRRVLRLSAPHALTLFNSRSRGCFARFTPLLKCIFLSFSPSIPPLCAEFPHRSQRIFRLLPPSEFFVSYFCALINILLLLLFWRDLFFVMPIHFIQRLFSSTFAVEVFGDTLPIANFFFNNNVLLNPRHQMARHVRYNIICMFVKKEEKYLFELVQK